MQQQFGLANAGVNQASLGALDSSNLNIHVQQGYTIFTAGANGLATLYQPLNLAVQAQGQLQQRQQQTPQVQPTQLTQMECQETSERFLVRRDPNKIFPKSTPTVRGVGTTALNIQEEYGKLPRRFLANRHPNVVGRSGSYQCKECRRRKRGGVVCALFHNPSFSFWSWLTSVFVCS